MPTADAGAESVLAKILAASRESRTGLFDTHPAPCDRIAAARARAEPGLFRIDAPAARLFTDPSGLSRAATLASYRDELGLDVSAAKLVPTATLAAESAARATAHQAVTRYFQRPLPAGAAFRPFLIDEPLPALPDVDVAAAGRDEARRRAEAAALERMAALERLDRACDPIRSRLDAALRLRRLPETAAAGPADEIDRRLATLAALRAAWGWIGELIDRTVNAVVVIKALADHESPPQSLVTAFQDRVAGLREVVVGLRESLADTPFPYDHAAENVSVGAHLVPRVPADDDHGSIIGLARDALDRENELFLRLTAELVERAEAIETALGLPRLTVPAAAAATAPE